MSPASFNSLQTILFRFMQNFTGILGDTGFSVISSRVIQHKYTIQKCEKASRLTSENQKYLKAQ